VPLLIFTVPKPFAGHIGVIQRNAVASWVRLPGARVVLFGNDPGVAQAAADLGAQHQPSIRTSDHGTPLLDSVFAAAQSIAGSDHLCYVNGDIILDPALPATVERVAAWRRRFFLVGRRWNFDQTAPLTFDDQWWPRLRQEVDQRGQMATADAIDYFVFPSGLIGPIPPFALGRTTWDNWLLFHAIQRGAALVDATPSVCAVHQNHPYSHLAGGQVEAWTGVEAQRNAQLAGHWSRKFTLDYAHWRATPDGIIRIARQRPAMIRAQECLALHPSLQRLHAAIRAVIGPPRPPR